MDEKQLAWLQKMWNKAIEIQKYMEENGIEFRENNTQKKESEEEPKVQQQLTTRKLEWNFTKYRIRKEKQEETLD